MRAIVADQPGEPEQLMMRDLAPPEPRYGEVRIKVAACALNFADLLMIRGQYQTKPPFPLIPGMEVSGRIDAIGPGVAGWSIGERVAAMCGKGGFADLACAPAAACARVPGKLDDRAAAAMIIAYGASDLALRERARLKRGETLLVLGAGGGVGLTAVEIGALMEAQVIAAARGVDKLVLANEKGADRLINLETEDLRARVLTLTGGRGADVVYDPVGGDLSREAMRAMAFEGRLMPIGFASGDVPQIPANHLLVKNIDVIGFWWGGYFTHRPEAAAESLRRIFSWADRDLIQPHISHVLKLEDAAEALNLLKERRASGKVVLDLG